MWAQYHVHFSVHWFSFRCIEGMECTQKICTKKCLKRDAWSCIYWSFYYLSKRNFMPVHMHVLYANVIKDTQKRNNYLGPFRSNKHQSVVVHFIISSFFFLLSSCVPIPILFLRTEREQYVPFDVSWIVAVIVVTAFEEKYSNCCGILWLSR